MPQVTYKDAGVDLELYEQAMAKLPSLMKKTHTPEVMPLPGGFAGLYGLFQKSYREPVLVSGTDGVGTKLKVASAAGRFDTIGIDLVGMCVNDCLCVGANPLFFLDYLALEKDDPKLVADLVTGISHACAETGMALLAGETAIMTDVYQPGEFDMAGFCVGVVERDHLVDGTKLIQPGDVVIGLESSGFHSNGYTLIRKVVTEVANLEYNDHIDSLGRSVSDVLLEPTRLYVKTVLSVLQDESLRPGVHGLAHITGGGLAENLTRVLPPNCRAVISRSSWKRPAAFDWLQSLDAVADDEMDRVFNMGIGFTIVVDPDIADAILNQVSSTESPAWKIGTIDSNGHGVELTD